MVKKIVAIALLTSLLLIPPATVESYNGSVVRNKNLYRDCWIQIKQEDFKHIQPITRTKESYLKALYSLDVENNYRYEPKAVISINGNVHRVPHREYVFWKDSMDAKFLYKETYCNIFAQDVLRIMDIEIPRILAENLFKWFQTDRDWEEVTYEEAMQRANQGIPSVVSMAYPGKIGHISMVRPTDSSVMHITQAGATNSNNMVYKKVTSPYVKYFSYIGD